MLVFDGQPALPAVRLERLNRELNRTLPDFRVGAARYVYFVDSDPAAALDRDALCSGLRATNAAPKPATLWVVPRFGTLSPWSTKATEILRGCGFDVKRVERGIAFTIIKPPMPGSTQWQKLAQVLCDPMTQSVLASLDDAQALFRAGAVAPLERIALGGNPALALAEANTRLGLALAPDEIDYLITRYAELGRDPTDVELMMFAGELRTLPAQGVQRELDDRRCGERSIAVRDDQEHAPARAGAHAVRVQGQRRGDRGQRRGALLPA